MKVDLFREHKDEYAMPRVPTIVEVGAGRYLTVAGRGDPSGEEFQKKVGAIYGTAYRLKFASKKRGHDFKVGVLEGLWKATGGRKFALATPRKTWRWKLLIRVPGSVTPSSLTKALAELRAKRGPQPRVKLETIHEGTSVQVLHVGAYGDEPATVEKMDALVKAKRLRYHGAHHEIYLSDPRRVPAARLRTILRHPVA